MKLDRIVVGVDFSEPSMRAATWVATALAPDAEIVLAHVIQIPAPPAPLRGLAARSDELESTARHGAEQRLRELVRGAAIAHARIEVRRGIAAYELQLIATEYEADAIVLGAPALPRGLRGRVGGTAERVVAESTVPVLVARTPSEGVPRHILAAINGSGVSGAVAEWGRAIAEGLHTHCTLLSVVTAPAPSTIGAVPASVGGPAAEVPENGGPSTEGRDAWIARELGPSETDRVPEVAFGEPAREIVAAAERHESGLIVMGRRGAGRARRMVFGSTVREVLRQAHCPVLVVMGAPE